jgi:hypothetical protein
VYYCISQALADSIVLSCVSDAVRLDFYAKLAKEWLPNKRFELLYRGSRDGMTPAAFHDTCDGKGPTLVLVAGQSFCKPECVFGGYAGQSWERGPEDPHEEASVMDAPDSFVFTVWNPFGDGIVKMAVNEESDYAGKVMVCHAGYGPLFGIGGFGVVNSSDSPVATFDGKSFCWFRSDGTFGDPLRRGVQTFTGAMKFTPFDIEVWSVC